MKSRLAKTLALIACLHLMGGHWLALQTVAWVGMFVENSREAPLSAALEKTFDGQHPCPLCKAVTAGQEEEDEQLPVDTSSKVNAILFVGTGLPPRSVVDRLYFEVAARPCLRVPSPPARPPWQV